MPVSNGLGQYLGGMGLQDQMRFAEEQQRRAYDEAEYRAMMNMPPYPVQPDKLKKKAEPKYDELLLLVDDD